MSGLSSSHDYFIFIFISVVRCHRQSSYAPHAQGQTETYYAKGFPVGTYDREAGKHYVNNHVHMIVDYHPMDTSEVSGNPFYV